MLKSLLAAVAKKEGGESYQPLCQRQRKKISVLLSASVERFVVSRMRDFLLLFWPKNTLSQHKL